MCESAHARKRPSTVGYRYSDKNLVPPGRIVYPHFHAVKVAAHVGSVFVSKWYVDWGSSRTHFL